MKPLVILLIAATIVAARSARPETITEVELRAEQCRDAPDSIIERREEPWRHLRRFAQLCPVRAPGGPLILSVLTIRVDRIIATAAVKQWEEDEPPRSLALDGRGHVLGTLSDSFPENPPGKLRVTFADCRDGWPHRIELYGAGVSALQPGPLPPMLWDPQGEQYVASRRQRGLPPIR
jgi:hypothetical protein